VFGVFLIYGGFKLMREGDQGKSDPSRNIVLKLCRRFLPLQRIMMARNFLAQEGRLLATRLLIVLLVVETTDILFATDPSRDPGHYPAIRLSSTRPMSLRILACGHSISRLSGLMKLLHRLNYGWRWC